VTAPRPWWPGRRAHDPPEVTWLDPELDDGAAAGLRPLDPGVEPELPELAGVLELAGLAGALELAGLLESELDVPALDVLLPCFADAAELVPCAAADAVVWACAALASPAVIPPPARTLAAPMVAVTARSRP
jgi:hypothetical protein